MGSQQHRTPSYFSPIHLKRRKLQIKVGILKNKIGIIINTNNCLLISGLKSVVMVERMLASKDLRQEYHNLKMNIIIKKQ